MSESYPGAGQRSPEEVALALGIANSIHWTRVDDGWDSIFPSEGEAVGRAYSWEEGITADFKLHSYHLVHVKVDSAMAPVANLGAVHAETDYSQPKEPFPVLIWEYDLDVQSGEFTIEGERTDTETLHKLMSDETAQAQERESIKQGVDPLEALKALGITKPSEGDWDKFIAILHKAADVSRLPEPPAVDTSVLQRSLTEAERRGQVSRLSRMLKWIIFSKERKY